MRVVRSSFRMTIELGDAEPEPAWPDGIAVRAFDPADGDERVFEAHQDGFADHWEFHPTPLGEWRQQDCGAPASRSLALVPRRGR